ncbi:MAG TPA: DHA2 family efflux MFS transporter permease subunit [Kofleriaceae bacterium]|nr:DHA2 family efflux MFS transporter permease subunit [Kofleriaceae bacterium]
MSQPSVNKWVVAISVSFGSLMATIDSSIINVALPAIRGELGASLEAMTWISTAYMIAMVVVMPLTGFLGALIGQKRLYLISMFLFVLGSALCGMARSLGTLTLFRIIQGLGGGAIQPTQQAILRQTFPPQEQGMAMAMFMMVVMVGPAIGPVLGGWIVDNYHWAWIFYINLPVGLLGMYLTSRNVHEPADIREQNLKRAREARSNFDFAGIGLMIVAVGSLQYLFEEGPQNDWFESTAVVVAFFAAIIGAAAFIIRELTATAPVVNLRLFRDSTFAAGTIIATIMFAVLVGSTFLLPVFMQEVLRLPATTAGLVLLPRTIAMMIASPIIGRLYTRVPPAWIVAFGVLLFIIGSWELSTVNTLTESSGFLVPLVITGFAFACLFVPLTTAALSHVERHQLADAAGLNSFMRQIGGSVGLTILTTLFTNYGVRAAAALSDNVTLLRPEVMLAVAQQKAAMLARGFDATMADGMVQASLRAKVSFQGLAIAFDKTFLLQAGLFLVVLPLLFFLRAKQHDEPSAPGEAIHVAIE